MHTCAVNRQQEGKASSDKLADLRASSARELEQMRKQAHETQSRSAEEAAVKLQAAQAAGEKLQGQVQQLQEASGGLHKQLADAHGKVWPADLFCYQVLALLYNMFVCIAACKQSGHFCCSLCLGHSTVVMRHLGLRVAHVEARILVKYMAALAGFTSSNASVFTAR